MERSRVHVHDPRRTVSASSAASVSPSASASWEDDLRMRLRRSPPVDTPQLRRSPPVDTPRHLRSPPGDVARLRRSPPVEMRRELERRRARERPKCGEVAGGTAAECAAVCCCVPFAVVELVVLAAVRAPAALCHRAVAAARRRRRAKRAAAAKRKEMEELLDATCSPRSRAVALARAGKIAAAAEAAADWPVTRLPDEVAEAEKEVWASFQGAGFWRSPSQREVKR